MRWAGWTLALMHTLPDARQRSAARLLLAWRDAR